MCRSVGSPVIAKSPDEAAVDQMVAAALVPLLGLLVADDPEPHPHPVLLAHRRGDDQHRRDRPLHVVGAPPVEPIPLDPRLELLRMRRHHVEVPWSTTVGASSRARPRPSAPAAPAPLRAPPRSLAPPATPSQTPRLPNRLRIAGLIGDQPLGESYELVTHNSPKRASGDPGRRRREASAGMWPKTATCNLIPAPHRGAATSGAAPAGRATQFPRRSPGSAGSSLGDRQERFGPVAVFLRPRELGAALVALGEPLLGIGELLFERAGVEILGRRSPPRPGAGRGCRRSAASRATARSAWSPSRRRAGAARSAAAPPAAARGWRGCRFRRPRCGSRPGGLRPRRPPPPG